MLIKIESTHLRKANAFRRYFGIDRLYIMDNRIVCIKDKHILAYKVHFTHEIFTPQIVLTHEEFLFVQNGFEYDRHTDETKEVVLTDNKGLRLLAENDRHHLHNDKDMIYKRLLNNDFLCYKFTNELLDDDVRNAAKAIYPSYKSHDMYIAPDYYLLNKELSLSK